MKVKPEWIGRFKIEATHHLVEANNLMSVLDWHRRDLSAEGLQTEKAQLRQLFLKAHSIKGTAGMVGFAQIAEVALELEYLWGEVLLDPTKLNTALQETTQEKTAELNRLVQSIKIA